MPKTVTLGRTGITVNFHAFGALPIQRADNETAVKILRKAYDGGMRYFDTARGYSDSEYKIGLALADVRKDIILATKTFSSTPEVFWKDLETSLSNLKTDYIDIYQFHNPAVCFKPGDGTGMYEAMQQAKSQGMIRHISITNHRMHVALEAVRSGLYDTLQFPFSYLSDSKDIELVKLCREHNIGFICMKALAGGLIARGDAACAWLSQFDNVLPIWGIQNERELDEFLSYGTEPPKMTPEMKALIETDRKQLGGNFCRGCGYCMPCPAKIEIPMCARMSLLLRRAPTAAWITPEWQEKMRRIEDCIDCGQCKSHCPYGLNTPELLKQNYADYKAFLN